MPIDQLPRIADVLAPGVTALVAARPSAERHTNTGRYGAVVKGLGAQAELARAYLSSEIKAGTLQAEGVALVEYLRSEFFATIDPTPLEGVGHVDMTRTIVNADPSTSALTPGIIRRGTTITRSGDQGFTPVVEQAEYVTLEDAVFNPNDTATTESNGEYTHVQTVSGIPVKASRTGALSSVPVLNEASVPHQVAKISTGALFESSSTWTAVVRCAGGLAEPQDDQLRQLAPYLGQGLFGPTGAAAMAGALSHMGVRYAAYRSNQTSGVDTIYVADGAWASSTEFEERVLSAMTDGGWIGFGSKVRVLGLSNTPTVVKPTVMLRGEDLRGDKSGIKDALREAARKYFDERPNWWTWSSETLRGALAAGSRKVLTVSAVQVLDRTGSALTPPASELSEYSLPTHHYLVGLEPTFITPS